MPSGARPTVADPESAETARQVVEGYFRMSTDPGRGAPIMLAMLIGVTVLPVWSAWGTMQALLER